MTAIKFKSKSDMARALGISRTTAQAWTSREDFPGPSGGPWRLDLIVQWIIARQLKRQPVDDPAMDGDDSPALERYRLARAALAELDLAAKQGDLLDRSKTRDFLARWAIHLRHAGESLQKRFGNEAAEILNSALNECSVLVHRELGPPAAEPSATAPAADHQNGDGARSDA